MITQSQVKRKYLNKSITENSGNISMKLINHNAPILNNKLLLFCRCFSRPWEGEVMLRSTEGQSRSINIKLSIQTSDRICESSFPHISKAIWFMWQTNCQICATYLMESSGLLCGEKHSTESCCWKEVSGFVISHFCQIINPDLFELFVFALFALCEIHVERFGRFWLLIILHKRQRECGVGDGAFCF